MLVHFIRENLRNSSAQKQFCCPKNLQTPPCFLWLLRLLTKHVRDAGAGDNVYVGLVGLVGGFITGWWLGTFFIFLYIGNKHSNWLFFFQRDWNHQPALLLGISNGALASSHAIISNNEKMERIAIMQSLTFAGTRTEQRRVTHPELSFLWQMFYQIVLAF